MLKLFNRKKKNNKGFTLVELVIVVAILAILVGLLAPQYTKYVEKSRKSADVDNMDELVKAVQVYAIDKGTEAGGNAAGTITIKLTDSGVDYGSDATAKAAFEEYVPNYTKIAKKSQQWGEIGKKGADPTVTLAVDEEGGVKVTKTEPTDFASYSDGKQASSSSSGTGSN